MYCPKCGTNNPDDAYYCVKCGKYIKGYSGILSSSTDGDITGDGSAGHPYKKKGKGGWLLLGLVGFIILVVVLAFVFPVAVGYLWMGAMVLVILAIKFKRDSGTWLIFIPMGFLALMGASTDIAGNHVTRYVLHKLACEPGDEIIIQKNVYKTPGETSVTYIPFRKTRAGEMIPIPIGWRLLAKVIVYFGFALVLIMLKLVTYRIRGPADTFSEPPEYS